MSVPRAIPQQRLSRRTQRRKIDYSAYAYLSPAIITIAVLSIAPIIYTIYIAFTNFDANHFMQYDFVGFKNFIGLFQPGSPLSEIFLPTLLWTFIYATSVTGLCYIVGLFLAVLLNNPNMKESTVYRVLLIIPWAVPVLISMLAWKGLLNTTYGQINGFLHLFGIHPIPWLESPFWARLVAVLVQVWAGFPYMMTVCLGALSAVPSEQYEAAEIDGASWWQSFRFLTMPSVWKLSLPLLIPSFSFNFNNVNNVILLTHGDPPKAGTQFAGATDILASAVYKMTLTYSRFDWGAVMSIMLFVIVAILALIQMKATKAFQEAD